MMRTCFCIRKFRCTTYIVKIFVFCFNFIFLIFGAVLITLGASYRLKLDKYTEIFDSIHKNFSLVPNIIVTCGILIFIVALLGTCGAATGSMCKLIVYVIMLLILFVVQAAIVGYLVVSTNYEDEEEEGNYKRSVYRRFLIILVRYNRSVYANEWIDLMQQHFECCGIGHPCDWVILTNTTVVPISCCERGTTDCDQSNSFQKGCLLPIFESIRVNADYYGGWLALISIFELSAAVVAVCLTNMIRVDEIIYDYPAQRPIYMQTPINDRPMRQGYP